MYRSHIKRELATPLSSVKETKMIRKIKQTIIGLLVLPALVTSQTVYAEESTLDRIGHQAYDAIVAKITTPLFGPKDTECLAKNIYYEAANEPEEGMVAVGVVTINRANDPRYPKTLCGVVKQRTTIGQAIVCQFSWTCTKVRKPNDDDDRWQKAVHVATRLSYGEYEEWQKKYANSFHFHAVHVNPGWKLRRIGRVGGHIFYH